MMVYPEDAAGTRQPFQDKNIMPETSAEEDRHTRPTLPGQDKTATLHVGLAADGTLGPACKSQPGESAQDLLLTRLETPHNGGCCDPFSMDS
eukprot:g17704.t1